jgi:aspartyl-tRNA(Asn)/glutamyl-tRNA(Gln) amidotransferase subunit A
MRFSSNSLMSELHELSASELLELFARGEATSVDATRSCLDRIERLDGDIGAFLSVYADQALDRAAEIDRRRQSGAPLGLLAGVPVAVKDVICIQDEVTTCGSKMLQRYRSPFHATVIERLIAADAVLLGKTNMDEFAMGGSTENSAFRPTRNPWDRQRTPGGSSGGAAASLAARMTPLSLGSDTGGSIRQPAAFCGVTGLKPTYGRVSRWGLVAFASSLDQIGPLARTAEDGALLLEGIAGHDPRDSTSAPRPAPEAYSKTVTEPLTGLRLGVVKEHFGEGLDAEVEKAVREAIAVYQSLGASVREVSLPHSRYAVATYYIIAPSEASSNLARYDGVHFGRRTDEKAMLAGLEAERKALDAAGDRRGLEELDSPLVRMYRTTRSEGFGPEVKRRIMLGTYTLSKGYYDQYYVKALKVRRLIRRDFDAAFQEVDLVIGPVAPTAAYRLGEKINDPLAMYLEDLYTVSANLAGIPGMSLPCGFTSNHLPIGVQLQAPPFAEDRLLRAARMFQEATDWHRRAPPDS